MSLQNENGNENSNKSLCLLTDYEKQLFYTLKCGDLNVLGVAVVPSENTLHLNQDKIRRALFFLKKRHPLLRAYLRNDLDTENIYFSLNQVEKTPDVELEWTCVADRANMIAELEKFNSKPFKHGHGILLWESKVIEFVENSSKYWALCMQLPIFITDGISITTLLVEFVNLINALEIEKECEEMRVELELAETLYDITKKTGLFTEKHETRLKELRNKQQNSFILSDFFKQNNEKGLKINLLRFESDLTRRLVRKCKENQCKLTGYINASLLYALKQLYEENGLEFPNSIACDITANLRLRYKPVLDFNNVRYQVFLCKMNVNNLHFGQVDNIWTDSETINRQIDASICIEDGSLFLSTHDAESLRHYNQVMRSALKNKSIHSLAFFKEHHSDLVISNTGRWVYDLKKQFDGPFKLKEIYYGDSLCSPSNVLSAILFHCAYWNDELQVCLSTNRSSIGSAFTDRFVQLFEKVVRESLF